MENKDQSMRFIPLDAFDLRIEALVPEKNNPEVFHKIGFKASSIDYLMEVNAVASAIVLKSGIVIPVWESFPTLNQKIHEPNFKDGGVLNLTAVTGEAARDITAPALADEFNETVRSGMKISAILRKANSNLTKQFEFFESDISSFSAADNTRSKTKLSTKIIFNDSVAKPPFGKEGGYLDMPYDTLMQLLVASRRAGLKKLDLIAVFAASPKTYGFIPE